MNRKPYPLNTKYLVSTNGEIINTETNRKLKPSKQKINGKETGYIYVSILFGSPGNWKIKTTPLHRVMAITFLDNPLNKPWVNHKDKNRSNNNVDNLEWSTISENIKHSYANGRKIYKGVEHWNYGQTASKDTRHKMSEAKKGDKHPKRKSLINKGK
tara:strand:- start:485 stop:955 length:471 start_codon:yes stop_codon:yes gene_type:complete